MTSRGEDKEREERDWGGKGREERRMREGRKEKWEERIPRDREEGQRKEGIVEKGK